MDDASSNDMEVLTWSLYGEASKALADMVADSGYQPDLILSIARGGLLIAGSLAYSLGIKNLHVMNIEFYTDVDARLPMPVVLPPVPRQVDLSEKKVLVVDDVADTGHTLRLVREVLAQHVEECRTAVLYHKSHSVIVPDYAWKQTDAWINFPWSVLPPVAGLPPR